MTSIHIYDPDDGTALPELPPLPIGVLAVGTADLLQQAADLPQPRCIFISPRPGHQLPVRPGAGERAGHHPLGAAVRQRHHQPAPPGQDGPETWHRADFDYSGIAVTAYAHIPAAPAAG